METSLVTDTAAPALVLASTQRTIGIVIVVVLLLAAAVLIWFNSRAARPALGAEIELAPNRKPYYDDDVLETKVLDRVLGMALVLLAIVAVGLPLYWLAEPGRQSGAAEDFQDTFIGRGESLFASANAGGRGGVAAHILLDSDGSFVAQVSWQAPALNTVLLRHDRSEVEFVLDYGRPGSPMAAWGAPGGGPLTTQQIDNLIDYMESITLAPEAAQAAATTEIERSLEAGEFADLGEAVFNLGLNSGFAGGAYSCGRCHTKGWSYGDPQEPGGGGPIGFSLRDGATERRFPSADDMVDFITAGSEFGVGYGVNGQGSGRMPGFEQMLTEEQIAAVVDYERGL